MGPIQPLWANGCYVQLGPVAAWWDERHDSNPIIATRSPMEADAQAKRLAQEVGEAEVFKLGQL